MTKPALAIGAALLLSACSFVKTIPGANQVIIANDKDSCKKVGETTVTVLDTVMWMDRDPAAIADELQILAQNSAVRMKANAIWPVSPVENGSRSYHILRCEPNR